MMRTLLFGIVFSSGAVALGYGYWQSHQAAAEQDQLASLEPIIGDLLDSPTTAARAEVGDLADGGNTAADGSMIGLVNESGAAGGAGAASGFLGDPSAAGFSSHGRVETEGADVGEGIEWIDFDRLAVPDYSGEPTFDDEARPAREDIFPEGVLALDGERVAIDGFMMPIDWVPGSREVAAFILSPYPPGCHFGNVPRMDEYIEATVQDEAGAPWLAYRAIRVIGTLEVGEEIDDYGYVMSIYRLDVESVESLW